MQVKACEPASTELIKKWNQQPCIPAPLNLILTGPSFVCRQQHHQQPQQKHLGRANVRGKQSGAEKMQALAMTRQMQTGKFEFGSLRGKAYVQVLLKAMED